jgi:class 3 adenylate cyclase
MMQIIEWLETRISLPGEDETARRQKAISFLPSSSTTVLALIWAIVFFAAGLAALGAILAVYAILTLILTMVPLLRARWAIFAVAAFGITGIVTNVLLHFVAGGFEAGVWFLVWIVILPLSVYLSGARREGVVVLVVALVTLAVALLVESRLTVTQPIPGWLQLSYNGFVLFTGVILLFTWGVYLFQQLDSARARADALLLNILPGPIAARLKRSSTTIADGYDEVTVLFADIVNFTTLSADADPVDVVAFLNALFSDFDELAIRHGLEKIKTIGDAYMVAGGLPTPRPDHCEAVVAFGLDMLAACRQRTAWHGEPVHLRVGINTGPVVAGVIGRHKFIYDLWGDAVNTASRMESNGVQDVIQVTAAVRDKLAGKYEFEARPPIYIKGKGEMVTYLLRPVTSNKIQHTRYEIRVTSDE